MPHAVAPQMYKTVVMMKPFTNFSDFSLATSVLAQLPPYFPERDVRVAHFLNHNLTDPQVIINGQDIVPFEECIRCFEPSLLTVGKELDAAVKQKLDAHAQQHPNFALPHFVLSPSSSQINNVC